VSAAHDAGHLKPEYQAAVNAADELFAVDPTPFNDASYHVIRSKLEELDGMLEHEIRRELNDSPLLDLFLKVRSYLPRKRR
jgi:hypothetical protein